MRCFSLKTGLSWLIGSVLVSTLLINIAIQLVHAGPRVRAEAESNLRLTRQMVLMTIATLPQSDDPLPGLSRLYESLGTLRHVDIRILAKGDPSPDFASEMALHPGDDAPNWFVSLIGAAPKVTFVPVIVQNKDYGRIAIVSNPLDELTEIWSDVSRLAFINLAVTCAILAVVLALVRSWLAPFAALRSGLAELEAGRDNVRIPLRGAAEFQNISYALNSLGATLDRVKDENRSLLGKLIQVQDAERREIARDLHDEAGPALFSIRAGAVALQDLASQTPPDSTRVRQVSGAVERASEALQQVFRGLLGRLRPRGLAEFGLNDALGELVASWKDRHPDVALDLVAPHDLSALDEAFALGAYRIVQEGLTNIYRHAGASRASVRVEFDEGATSAGDLPDAVPVLKITIEDDGRGLPQNCIPGLGLLGMRERVQALGGAISIENREEKGTRVLAALPLPDDDEE
ncbi:histidine kinase [Methylocapsa palsarum]|uniref:histidine kinase n=1 Tax=Methylocapsa palsarum TaxID=1612308 RepID=A0A1I4AZL9_9HYPH|nr:histidine kinase [Methylocapsa palsarum]SFK61357.1 two-component system, NarL family, sensor histidine kinase UhpB [Methylocapsa palsarum]